MTSAGGRGPPRINTRLQVRDGHRNSRPGERQPLCARSKRSAKSGTAMIKKMTPSESDFAIPAKNCYRMVILGSTKVGKTAIVSRFLNGRFDEQYTPTIEDFHRKLYSIKGDVYQLDILDTSGNHPFPAMRRLSILTGTQLQQLFILKCAVGAGRVAAGCDSIQS